MNVIDIKHTMKIEKLGNFINLTKGKKHQETNDSRDSRYIQNRSIKL